MTEVMDKWDRQYLKKNIEGNFNFPEAPAFLKDHWQRLKPGRILDLASGDGAVSLFLMDKGEFSLCAVDISGVGLGRLSELSASRGYGVECYRMDLEHWSVELEVLGQFDSIIISRYKPMVTLWPKIIDLLKPEGRLLITTFNMLHHHNTGFSQRFCLEDGEYIDRFPELELLEYQSELNELEEDGYLFMKR